MTCRWKGINCHRTTDAVSSGAAKSLQVAKFPAGHSAVCNCVASNGKIPPEDCDGLCVYDGNNAEVAKFTGKRFRAQQNEDGSISVWRLPDQMTEDRSARPCRDHSARIAAMNAKNADFWQRKDAE